MGLGIVTASTTLLLAACGGGDGGQKQIIQIPMRNEADTEEVGGSLGICGS